VTDAPIFRALLGHVYGRAGDRKSALGIVSELSTIATQKFVSPMDFARVYAGLGDADSTFHWLEKAYQVRAIGIQELPSMYFDTIRSDSRYAPLLRRVGLAG
jgi:hypothetical protein